MAGRAEVCTDWQQQAAVQVVELEFGQKTRLDSRTDHQQLPFTLRHATFFLDTQRELGFT